MAVENMLEISHLTHVFPLWGNLFIKALDDVSFSVRRGEIFGLVGESGSGKSTLARLIMNVYQPCSGRIFYKGIDTADPRAFRQNKGMLQTSRQFIFQDSGTSLNQRMKVEDIVTEPLRIAGRKPDVSYRRTASEALGQAGLTEWYLDRYPANLSGGERQRVAIARALVMKPELIVADEPIASLDASMQAQMVNLFRRLQEEREFTFLFIAHDLAVVKFLCSRVGVMYRGRLVEVAETEELFKNPLHAYTRVLMASIPIPDPRKERGRKIPVYEPDSEELAGELLEAAPGHLVRTGRQDQ